MSEKAMGANAARKRAAVEIVTRYEPALRRTARRYSLCADDAEDAFQRALEILLTKAPTTDPRELIRWTQTVTKHEALAVRRSREQTMGRAVQAPGEGEPVDWVALIPRRGSRAGRACGAAGSDRPQPRGHGGTEAGGAAGVEPPRRRLLLRRDRPHHGFQRDERFD